MHIASGVKNTYDKIYSPTNETFFVIKKKKKSLCCFSKMLQISKVNTTTILRKFQCAFFKISRAFFYIYVTYSQQKYPVET